jgi:hypothetical protein
VARLTTAAKKVERRAQRSRQRPAKQPRSQRERLRRHSRSFQRRIHESDNGGSCHGREAGLAGRRRPAAEQAEAGPRAKAGLAKIDASPSSSGGCAGWGPTGRRGTDAAEQTLEDATLVAPIDGVVCSTPHRRQRVEPARANRGSPVSPQAAPFTVVDSDALKFTAEVDEADIIGQGRHDCNVTLMRSQARSSRPR